MNYTLEGHIHTTIQRLSKPSVACTADDQYTLSGLFEHEDAENEEGANIEDTFNASCSSTHTQQGDFDSLAETIEQCTIGNPTDIENEVSQHISNREHVKAMFLSGKKDNYFRSVINTYYPKKYDFQYGHANDQFTIECQHFPGHCLLTLKDSNGRFLAKKRITDIPPIDQDTGAKPKEIIQGNGKLQVKKWKVLVKMLPVLQKQKNLLKQ